MLPDGLLGRLAGTATGAVLDPPQGLHLDWWTWLQLDSGAVVQWGPGWDAWCPAFPQCHQAPAAGQPVVALAASPHPWVVDLDYFSSDQKRLVLQECALHSGGALVVTRGTGTQAELVE
eukprot:2034859-Rhodomonas_salina.1